MSDSTSSSAGPILSTQVGCGPEMSPPRCAQSPLPSTSSTPLQSPPSSVDSEESTENVTEYITYLSNRPRWDFGWDGSLDKDSILLPAPSLSDLTPSTATVSDLTLLVVRLEEALKQISSANSPSADRTTFFPNVTPKQAHFALVRLDELSPHPPRVAYYEGSQVLVLEMPSRMHESLAQGLSCQVCLQFANLAPNGELAESDAEYRDRMGRWDSMVQLLGTTRYLLYSPNTKTLTSKLSGSSVSNRKQTDSSLIVPQLLTTALRPSYHRDPTFVTEISISEAATDLTKDAAIWLTAGDQSPNVVVTGNIAGNWREDAAPIITLNVYGRTGVFDPTFPRFGPGIGRYIVVPRAPCQDSDPPKDYFDACLAQDPVDESQFELVQSITYVAGEVPSRPLTFPAQALFHDPADCPDLRWPQIGLSVRYLTRQSEQVLDAWRDYTAGEV